MHEKIRGVRVYLSTHTVGYSGSPSTVNETKCNKKRSLKTTIMSSTNFLDVSHQEKLEEECHLLYCCGDIGSVTHLTHDEDGY